MNDGDQAREGRPYGLTRRVRDVLGRGGGNDQTVIDAAGGDPASAGTSRVDPVLRVELLAAIDRVVEVRVSDPAERSALTARLRAAVGKELDDHATAESLRDKALAVPSAVQDAMEMLAGGVSALLAGNKQRTAGQPGGRRQSASRIVAMAAPVLLRYLDDPVKLQQAQRAMERVLSRYMSPSTAERIVRMALQLATSVARNLGQRGDDKGSGPRSK